MKRTKILLAALLILPAVIVGWTFLVDNFMGKNLDPTTFQAPSNDDVPKFNSTTGKWEAGAAPAGVQPDASTTVKGITKLSVAPVSATDPIAAGDNDSRMTNARTPTAHASSHQDSGSDELSVQGLAGLLADGQTPLAHASSHQDSGSDELSVQGLAGLLADGQTPLAHASSHQDSGSDELSVQGLAGLLADGQTPLAHASTHNAGGADAMAIDAAAGTGSLRTLGTGATNAAAGNDSRLSDARTPTAHAASHQNSGSDEVATATPAANAIPKADGSNKLAAGWISQVLASSDLTDVTAAGTALINDASASDQRTTLGVPATTRAINTGTGLTGGGDLSSDRTIALDTSSQNAIFQTGDIKPSFSTGQTGWVNMSGTIGSAASGATQRANADTEPLYTMLYNNLADAQAPVSGGRGASAAADFAANKTLTLPVGRGRVLVGQETSESLITNAVSGFSGATLGATGGAQSHTLTITEMPSHTHGLTNLDETNTTHDHTGSSLSSNSVNFDTTETAGVTAARGGDGAHRNVQPTLIVNWLIKL